MVAEKELNNLIDLNGWRNIPNTVVTREGISVDLKGDVWHLPIPTQRTGALHLYKVSNSKILWAVKIYVVHRIEKVSTISGYNVFKSLWWKLLKYQVYFNIASDEDFKDGLIALIENAICKARSDHNLCELYEPIKWYLWCADRYPELGFCPAFALELDGMVIPGGPKGEAVRMGDPDCGPLHRSLELPLLINALRGDSSTSLLHLQQRAAVALSIALGRNPSNLTYLRGYDFFDLTPESSERCYIIQMPRIKKRQINPRDDRLDEYLAPEFARHLTALISKNMGVETTVEVEGKKIDLPKPLFINIKKNRTAIAAGQWMYTYNMTSYDICELVQSFVKRHRIISPVTGAPLEITVRRLRYTLATNLAAEGISKRELARILDHTDTQHVQVYFEIAGNIVEHLDKAAAKSYSKYINFFKGKIVESDEEAINGNRVDKHLFFVNENNPEDHTDIGVCGKARLCHLDPPYSCYLCPKFQPYRQADHEQVLDCLLESREERMKKYEKARLGMQLDEVITAVTQVVRLCKPEVENG